MSRKPSLPLRVYLPFSARVRQHQYCNDTALPVIIASSASATVATATVGSRHMGEINKLNLVPTNYDPSPAPGSKICLVLLARFQLAGTVSQIKRPGGPRRVHHPRVAPLITTTTSPPSHQSPTCACRRTQTPQPGPQPMTAS